jgi:hypothetical protein
MPTPPLSREELIRRYQLAITARNDGYSWSGYPNVFLIASHNCELSEYTLRKSYKTACAEFPQDCPDLWDADKKLRRRPGVKTKPPPTPPPEVAQLEPEATQYTDYGDEAPPDDNTTPVEKALKRRDKATLVDLAEDCNCTPGQVYDAILELREKGVHVQNSGDIYWLQGMPSPAFADRGAELVYTSREDNTFVFARTTRSFSGPVGTTTTGRNTAARRFWRNSTISTPARASTGYSTPGTGLTGRADSTRATYSPRRTAWTLKWSCSRSGIRTVRAS